MIRTRHSTTGIKPNKDSSSRGQRLRSGILFVLVTISVYCVGVRVGSQNCAYQQNIRLASTSSNGNGEGSLLVAAAVDRESAPAATATASASTADALEQRRPPIQATGSASTTSRPIVGAVFIERVLDVPQGQAKALPSIRHNNPKDDAARSALGTNYGGAGDKLHLGGFTKYDGMGVSPAVWQVMMRDYGIQSIMDVGCGRGISTLYFLEHGADVLCIEGSHDAVEKTILPDREHQIVEHDFSRGPYWPAKTYDAVWSVEFLEHIGRNFQYNYIQSFRKAALIFVTHSQWGGWHHVEVHDDDWWLAKFQMFGFHYSEQLTRTVLNAAGAEAEHAGKNRTLPESLGPDGNPWNAQHIWLNLKVFVNPAVAALPQHAHLMAEPGCFKEHAGPDGNHRRKCDKALLESELPESYFPLELTPEKHNAWMEKVKADIASQEAS